MEEGSTLYRGWGWTVARNAPGSFAVRTLLIWLHFTFWSWFAQLFGASAVTKEYVLGVTDYSSATWAQNFVASVAGAVASITVAAPLDTVKTRIQNANFENKVRGVTVIKEMIKNEGMTAFFKGLTPKVRLLCCTSCVICSTMWYRSWWWAQSWCSATRSPNRSFRCLESMSRWQPFTDINPSSQIRIFYYPQ